MMITLPDQRCEPFTDAPPRSTMARIGATLRGGWSALRAHRRRRATIRSLRALDDRTLSDIGLDRSEIASVVEQRCGVSERRQHVLSHLFRV